MTVGHQHSVIPRAPAVRRPYPPAVLTAGTLRFDARDLGVEGDVAAQLESVREGLDVGAHLVSARVDREFRRHRETLEARYVARSDQMQRLVVGVPVPTDPVG